MYLEDPETVTGAVASLVSDSISVTFLALFSLLVTYLAVCATIAAVRVLESRLSTWRSTMG